jgi:formate/nitrite transporter FocA (FNT family)
VKGRGAVYFSALVTALFGAVFLLLVFETWALATGQRPITSYVRATVHTYPGWAFAVAIVSGILVGHVLWGAPDRPPGAGVRGAAPR